MTSAGDDRITCQRCGNPVEKNDKFCGTCGANVPPATQEDPQVIPKPVAQQAAPPVSRKKWLFVAAGVLLVPVLILVVSISSRASGDTELTSGVRSTVPEGWIARDGVLPGTTQVIPESYRGTDINNFYDIASEEAVIAFYGEESGFGCDVQPDEVNTDSVEIASGYDEIISASGALTDGNGTVAGKPANWVLDYSVDAGPQFLEGEVPPTSLEYPAYYSNIGLVVCVEELELRAELHTSSNPFGIPPDYSGEELTATNNASTPEVREEAHQELERRYEANIGALLSVLENVDTDEWDGSTDLDGIPTTLNLLNDIPEDPFQGELEDNAFEVAESFDAESPKTEETSTGSEPSPASVSPDSPADSAFDPLMAELQSRTDVQIMLPAELPEKLQNVAVDESTSGDRYGVGFFVEPQDSVVEYWSKASSYGILQTTPVDEAASNEYFEAESVEEVELPDGTIATLRLLSPVDDQSGTQGEFWEGKFQRDDNEYSLVFLNPDRLTKDEVMQVLSSMVSVPDEGATQAPESTPEGTEDNENVEAQDFVFSYYDAVGQQDWATTYSLLADTSREEFTEDEWVEIQEIRQTSEGEPASLESVDTEVTGEFVLSADLTFSDGSTGTTTVLYTPSSEEYGRLLTDEDISYLKNLAGGNEESGDEETAVEETIRNHYEAIGDNDFVAALVFRFHLPFYQQRGRLDSGGRGARHYGFDDQLCRSK